ncbi:MAG TPA: ATP-binding cassette domain-containing protein [Sporichthyaceae bacterium]|jgi:putative ABC transport system ATP-binding protein|nr:ATP-binding cassette domain-containing protein [Sporichthyaceae bacterium]
MRSLEVRDLTVEFVTGGYQIRPLDNFSFHADSGELILLLGPSGCGKTTLLSCLAGILTPKSGSITVDGKEVTRLGPKARTEYRRRDIGLVFQGFKLVPSLSARENVEAPLRLAGVSRQAARARSRQLLTSFGLADRLNNRPGRLSGGQQQRVAIARALAHDPPLLLADEPTASLDYIQVEIVVRMLRDLAQPGRLVIVSTHDQRLIPLADRVVRLEAGHAAEEEVHGRIRIEPGQVLFEQGARSDYVYTVEEGVVELARHRADGSQEFLTLARAGDHFGEVGPLLGLPRAASARGGEGGAVLELWTIAEFRRRLGPDGVRQALGTRLAGPTTREDTEPAR